MVCVIQIDPKRTSSWKVHTMHNQAMEEHCNSVRKVQHYLTISMDGSDYYQMMVMTDWLFRTMMTINNIWIVSQTRIYPMVSRVSSTLLDGGPSSATPMELTSLGA